MESFNLLDVPEVLNVMFYPRRESGDTIAEGMSLFVEMEDSIKLGSRLYSANPTSPLILYFHGNGEIAVDYGFLAPLYRNLGISLWVIDYRGYGQSTGSPTASDMLRDAKTIYQKKDTVLQPLEIRPSRIYVMGRSLGSAPAIEVAGYAGDQIPGLIIDSGFAYTFPLIERMGYRVLWADEEKHGFGNLSKLTQVKCRCLFIHGLEDVIIPAEEGKLLYEYCGSKGKKLLMVPHAGHNNLIAVGYQDYFDAIRKFVFEEW